MDFDAKERESRAEKLCYTADDHKKMLTLLQSIQKRDVRVQLLDGKPVNCTIECCEPSFKFIVVRDLQTPIGLQPTAILRTEDIGFIEFL
ncbi:major abundant protein BTP1 [Sarcoptes scabiei]|nr:major abundant protein BTP1 [Sarcoptes scabiei]